ncbi:MAG: N-6 DNA methylase [Anaerolineae bacterium]|nr:N-6 DNA methylase [Anaerolineae bacterium]
MRKSRRRAEFGDFQTPPELANSICRLLFELGAKPLSIVEPTCGRGNFLVAALGQFASAVRAVGIDINSEYVECARDRLATQSHTTQLQLSQGNFFNMSWGELLDSLPDPILVIGNPPWITSSELTSLNSTNLPKKTNFRELAGLDAKTGKSNFDISEWMLIHILEFLDGRDATMAMLCKTGVARKVLGYAWKRNLGVHHSQIYLIDAKKTFGASVDAGLLVCSFSTDEPDRICHVYADWDHPIGTPHDSYRTTFGYRDGRMIANIEYYERWKHLENGHAYEWRSGIKHDCSKVMELEQEELGFRNKLGELYDLEVTYLYPMLKSSDIANGTDIFHPLFPQQSRWMLVPQKSIGEDTISIKHVAPKTWAYLIDHYDLLDKRRSSVYKRQPRFAVFGVGKYSFSPWKVAISGLYKKLHFIAVGPYGSKPVVLDDTCYFIPCQSEREARYLVDLLNSTIAKEFFEAFIFWDAKRPITASILNRLSLLALAKEMGTEDKIMEFLSARSSSSYQKQLALF